MKGGSELKTLLLWDDILCKFETVLCWVLSVDSQLQMFVIQTIFCYRFNLVLIMTIEIIFCSLFGFVFPGLNLYLISPHKVMFFFCFNDKC